MPSGTFPEVKDIEYERERERVIAWTEREIAKILQQKAKVEAALKKLEQAKQQ